MRYVNTREVITALAPRYIKGKTLDIGGGTSKYADIIKAYASRYLSADLYETKNNNRKEDVRHMSFPNDEFDSIVSFQLLEHVDDVTASTKEMYRVLKKGGYAMITMPFLFPQHGDPSDFHRFTKEAARFYFERAGFSIVEIGSQGSTLSVIAGILRQMYLSHYVKTYGKLRRAFFTRLIAGLAKLDKLGYFNHQDIYSNVYIVCRKN